MKIRKLMLTLGLLGTAFFIQAQSPNNRLKLENLMVSVGAVRMPNAAVSMETAQAYFPESMLLQRDFSGYSHTDWSQSQFLFQYPSLQVSAGFRRRGANESSGIAQRLSFRVGAMIHGSQPAALVLTAHTRTPWDTLTSSRTGQVVLLDSAWDSQLHYNLRQIHLQVSASCHLDVLDKGRISIQAGLGVTSGISLDSYSEVSYFEQSMVVREEGYFPYFPIAGTENFQHRSEWERKFHSPDYISTAYLPVTLAYRVSKDRPEKARWNVFYELRPTAFSNFTPGGNWQGGMGLAQQVGLRIDLPE